MKQRPALVPLGETEMDVLRVVWESGDATVADVHTRLSAARPLAYTTILTVMRNLAEKGYLAATREGRQDRYRPTRSPETVRQSLLGGFLARVFDGDPAALVQTLVRAERLTDDDRAALRRLLDDL
ncbi:MAG: BlaI/MecI/CopY family transcriptional regulator [Rhodothermales bacterium]|nr:BlaI/MecI/CopY family transcriptional regulator [Rhodothermales bacterium]